jgi:hypothetical protein
MVQPCLFEIQIRKRRDLERPKRCSVGNQVFGFSQFLRRNLERCGCRVVGRYLGGDSVKLSHATGRYSNHSST